MKKKILSVLAAACALFGACGPLASVSTATSDTSSQDSSMLSFVTDSGTPLEVTVDDNFHAMSSIKTSSWQKNRDFKRDSRNAVVLPPGSHEVVVKLNGKQIYKSSVNVSASERKVITLGDVK